MRWQWLSPILRMILRHERVHSSESRLGPGVGRSAQRHLARGASIGPGVAAFAGRARATSVSLTPFPMSESSLTLTMGTSTHLHLLLFRTVEWWHLRPLSLTTSLAPRLACILRVAPSLPAHLGRRWKGTCKWCGRATYLLPRPLGLRPVVLIRKQHAGLCTAPVRRLNSWMLLLRMWRTHTGGGDFSQIRMSLSSKLRVHPRMHPRKQCGGPRLYFCRKRQTPAMVCRAGLRADWGPRVEHM